MRLDRNGVFRFAVQDGTALRDGDGEERVFVGLLLGFDECASLGEIGMGSGEEDGER